MANPMLSFQEMYKQCYIEQVKAHPFFKKRTINIFTPVREINHYHMLFVDQNTGLVIRLTLHKDQVLHIVKPIVSGVITKILDKLEKRIKSAGDKKSQLDLRKSISAHHFFDTIDENKYMSKYLTTIDIGEGGKIAVYEWDKNLIVKPKRKLHHKEWYG